MISSLGLVPPIVYPQPDPHAYDAAATAVTVTAAGANPLAVDVTVTPERVQSLPDETVLPLDTIIAPHHAQVSFLPAGTPLVQIGWPKALGPFARDAWVVDALGDRSTIAALLPAINPTPVYWVLEGVRRSSVDDPAHPGTGLLDRWMSGLIPGLTARTQECHDATDAAQQRATPQLTWKARMLAGTWAEQVEAETALGLVAPASTQDLGSAGAAPGLLTIWAATADGTLFPAGGVLAAFTDAYLNAADKELLTAHPIVTGCQAISSDLPVRFFLRFQFWNVDTASPTDAKGAPTLLEPDRLDLTDASTHNPIPGCTWTWQGTYGILAVPRRLVSGATFWAAAQFAAVDRVRLERGRERFWPTRASTWTWLTRDWIATDTVTLGTWTNFGGLQVGTQTQPVTFWVGTKVRLAVAYQQQPRAWYGEHNSAGKLTSHRVAAGHALHVFRNASTLADAFVTDDDGEVSGVNFTVLPGESVTVGLVRRLDLDPVSGGSPAVLLAVDDPSTTTPLFSDGYFRGEDARVPVRFPAFATNVLGATEGPTVITIDAHKTNDSLGNTVHAAAFHALKYARFTHDAVTLLKGDSRDLPQLHEFRLRYTTDAAAGADTSELRADPPHPARSYTRMAATTGWFSSHIIVHEYGHALVAWLGTVLQDQARYDAYEDASGAIYDRLESELHYPKGKGVHNEGQISNSGVALAEGLAQFFECLLGSSGRFSDGRTTSLKFRHQSVSDPTRQGWPQYTYGVWQRRPDGTSLYRSLSADSGRRVEGVFALALFDYLQQVTGFPGFLVEQDDTASGSRPRQGYLDDWTGTLPAAERADRTAQLQRLFTWLVTDAIGKVHSQASTTWTGRWPAPPDPSGTAYPTVLDYLALLELTDPDRLGSAPTPEESFKAFFDTCALPWRLEPVDPNEPNPPQLAPDPPSPEWS